MTDDTTTPDGPAGDDADGTSRPPEPPTPPASATATIPPGDGPADEPGVGDGPGAGGATPPSRPPFRRASGTKVLGGVAGGLARSFDLDPVHVRLGLVVAAVVVPPVLLAYLAAWALVADDTQHGEQRGPVVLKDGGLGFWLGVGLLVLIGINVVAEPFLWDAPLVPLVLIGIGIALWTRDGDRRPARVAPAASSAAPGAPSATPATSWPAAPVATATPPVGGSAGPPPPAVPAPVQPPVPPTPRPKRPRSKLGAVTVALALIAAGVVAALDAGAVLDVAAYEIAAVALLVVGLGLVVGSVVGRARWLVLVALLLVPPVAGGAVVSEVADELGLSGGLELGDGIGERVVRAVGPTELEDEVRLLAGSVVVDLEEWTPDEATLDALDGPGPDLLVEVGAGEVVLTLPDDVAYRVVADVGLGELEVRDRDGVTVLSESSADLGDRVTLTRSGGPVGGPVLDIEIDVAFGAVDVRNADAEGLS